MGSQARFYIFGLPKAALRVFLPGVFPSELTTQCFLFEFVQTQVRLCAAPPPSPADKLHHQAANFTSFPPGCPGARFRQCLPFTTPLQPVRVCFYDLMQLADFVGFQMSLAPLFKPQLLYASAATRMLLYKSPAQFCAVWPARTRASLKGNLKVVQAHAAFSMLHF